MKITIKVEEHQGKRGRWKAIKVSENTGEMIKSFETRRFRTCSWRRKGDNSNERERKEEKLICSFQQTLNVMLVMFHITSL